MNYLWVPTFEHAKMKSDWAGINLDALERKVKEWIDGPPYTIVQHDDVDLGLRFYVITIQKTPWEIPMLDRGFRLLPEVCP